MDFNRLITEVKKRPAVYDKRRRDAVSKAQSWDEISEEMGLNVPECQYQWRLLRDRYCREKKMEITEPHVIRRKWAFMDNMDFMRKHIQHRRRLSKKASKYYNQVQMNESSCSYVDDNNGEGSSVASTPHEIFSGDIVTYYSDSPSPRTPSPKPEVFHSPIVTLNTNMLNGIKTEKSPSVLELAIAQSLHASQLSMQRSDNEDELFGLSIAASLRKLPSSRKHLAKMKIYQVLYEMESDFDNATSNTVNNCNDK